MKKLIYLFVILLLVVACNGGSGNSSSKVDEYNIQNPNTAEGNGDMSKLPQFTFKETEFNFGSLVQGEKVSHIFVFTNTGGSNLIIKEVKASCGCTTPKWTREPVKPGEKGSIEVIFDSSGREGEQSKTVKVEANTQPNMVELRIKCDVITK
ncbi:MAG TPA: DUF1573 domain-containing protein [Bacteroidales bacterium]|nr:DUF1573 domain-containing protein [Bacteroidales bacterium]HOE06020.1 DUF1573 domain-containing protein [Bacteroidales bacterium]